MTEFIYCPECQATLVNEKSSDGITRPSCQNGHFTHYDNPAPTVVAFIEQNKKYLILMRAVEPQRGKWELPDGFMEGDNLHSRGDIGAKA